MSALPFKNMMHKRKIASELWGQKVENFSLSDRATEPVSNHKRKSISRTFFFESFTLNPSPSYPLPRTPVRSTRCPKTWVRSLKSILRYVMSTPAPSRRHIARPILFQRPQWNTCPNYLRTNVFLFRRISNFSHGKKLQTTIASWPSIDSRSLSVSLRMGVLWTFGTISFSLRSVSFHDRVPTK